MKAKSVFAGVVAVLASLVLTSAAAGTSTTLIDQNNNYGYTQIISDGSIGRQAADDFVVPAGRIWSISEVDATGEICLPSTSVTAQIYADASGVPGALLDSTVVTTADGLVQTGCNFVVPVGFTGLGEGHYWLSLITSDMWYWSARYPANGDVAAFISPLEFGPGWKPLSADISWWNYDVMFALQGTSVAADTTPPTITITTPAEGATYVLGQSVLADYGCTDESGVATCAGPVADGAAIDTSTLGAHAFTVDASDTEGNTGSATTHYTVVYDWHGFFQPVANDVLNVVKAGSSVPAKFGLGGYQGMDVVATGYPQSAPIDCSTLVPTGSFQATAMAGASGLGYDATLGQYSYVWKTDKGWAGTCRRLDVKLADGQVHPAYFQFIR